MVLLVVSVQGDVSLSVVVVVVSVQGAVSLSVVVGFVGVSSRTCVTECCCWFCWCQLKEPCH